MNPLTLVKRTQKITAKEAELGISEEASWHATYKDSAYVFAGGLPYDLTEGDLLAVFAQYGEIVDVNLVREKSTGKSKGFAFIAYEDQRSTTLAVDNLNGAQLAGRTLRVDHVANYKKKEEEDEETEKQKREERGVCRAFQRGECKYGDSCRFSHDAQRAADTGWGQDEERKSKSAHDKFVNRSSDNKSSRDALPSCIPEQKQPSANDGRSFSGKKTTEFGRKRNEISSGDRDQGFGDRAKRLEHREDRDKGMAERKSSRYEPESNKSGDRDEREEINTRRNIHDERDRDRGRDRDRDRVRDISKDRKATDWDKDRDADRTKQSVWTRDNSSQRHRDQDRDAHRLSRRDEDYHRPRR